MKILFIILLTIGFQCPAQKTNELPNDKSIFREAFNKTQLEIKVKYPQPYYWGAFILVGSE
jgi:hypothetical protein